MYSSLMLGLALTVGAPAAKEAPKKDAPSIVGDWNGEKAVSGGKEKPVPEGGVHFTFTADGKLSVIEGKREKPENITYKIDPKKSPSEIDIEAPGEKGSMLGIFKIEGDTLTMCFSQPGNPRPTAFESPEGARTMLMTLKRAKK